MAEAMQLDVQELMAQAQQQAGLDDFGGDDFIAPMTVLVKALNEEANLNAGGLYGQRQRCIDLLVNRLRVQDYLARFPEIRDEEIKAPLVIVGLPRTGTTMLHRLIASDPQMNAVYWYENRNPAPFPGWDFASPDPRIAAAQAQVEAMLQGAPELAAIHPLDPLGPDEEVLLMEHSFVSDVPETGAHIPSYTAWLDEHGYQAGYEYTKTLLQFLQWQKKKAGVAGDSWILKSPVHLASMENLFDVFPDATIVQTHRDPLQTIPSIASMFLALFKLGADAVDAKAIGAQALQTYSTDIDRTLAFRKQHPERFIDLWYQDAIREPLVQVKAIYQAVGKVLTPEAEQAMAAWKEDNSRDKRQAHEYTLEQFGFTEALLKERFRAYREAYIEPRL